MTVELPQLPDITDKVLDQWEESARADHAADQVWSCHPLAILAVIEELRDHRSQRVTGHPLPHGDDQLPLPDWEHMKQCCPSCGHIVTILKRVCFGPDPHNEYRCTRFGCAWRGRTPVWAVPKGDPDGG